MKEIELEKYLRNHSFPSSEIKIKIDDLYYDIKEVKYTGIENGDQIIIEVIT